MITEAVKLNLKHGVPLSKKERNEIIKKLYKQNLKTQREIADIIGLSQSRVAEILGISETDKTYIYYCIQFAKKFTEQQVEEKLNQGSKCSK